MKYTNSQIKEFRNKAINDNPWSFLEQLLEMMYHGKDFGNWEIHLNGGRKSGKTYRACEFIAKATLMLPNAVDGYAFRWLKTDAKDLMYEMEAALTRILERDLKLKELNLSDKRFNINGNTIKVMGIHNPNRRKDIKLMGLKRAENKKYGIIILEECYEFNDNEILAIQHAIGGYKNLITIYISNPNTLNTPYLKRLSTILEHKSSELVSKGYQFKQVAKKVYFYNNWRINPFITNTDIETLSQTWEIDEERAKVVDWGIPGVEAGRIYSNEYHFIKQVSLKQMPWPRQISIGIDWGDGQTDSGSATTAMIVGTSANNDELVMQEYYHHNKDGYKSVMVKSKEIIDMIVNFFDKPEYDYFKRQVIDVILDTGLYSERDQLILECDKRNIYWLNFKFALKNLERTRINIRKYKMATNRYWVNTQCTNHLEELANQMWDETKKDKQGLPLQQDSINHTTDACDYAISYNQYEITDEDRYKMLHKK